MAAEHYPGKCAEQLKHLRPRKNLYTQEKVQNLLTKFRRRITI